jgi:hypothetical protein
VHELSSQPGGADEVHGFGATVEHRLGAHVDDDATDFAEPELAADHGRGLEHLDDGVRTGRPDPRRRGEAGDPGTDHDDRRCPIRSLHPATVPSGSQSPRGRGGWNRRPVLGVEAA